MSARLAGLVVVASLALFGCAGESAEAEGGGGVEGAATLEQELRIDGVEHEFVLIGYLGGVAVRDDGTIAVRQGQDNRIRFFTADGEPAGTFGGPGEGPGEFRGMGRLGWLADTLWVLDPRTARITLIGPDFTLGRIVPVPTQARPAASEAGRIPSFPFSIPLTLHADGTFLSWLDPGLLPGVPEDFRQVSVFATVTAEGLVRDIHARIRQPDGASVMSEAGVVGVPFVHRVQYAVAPDGSRMAIAEGAGDDAGGSVRISALDMRGDTLFSRIYPFDPVPIPQNVRDSTMTARESELRARSPELADAFRDRARPPAIYPPVTSLVVGNDGSIWIERPDTGGERVYFAIAPDGEPLGTVELPRSSRLASADRTRVWILERDENDVESVVRYRVRRPR